MKPTKTVKINMLVLDKSAPLPRTAYGGTSAAFDIAATSDVTIKPGEYKIVPVGQRFSIDQNESYYMQVHLRSSFGFKRGLRCHIGIIDAGYTGDFGVSVVNNTADEITIKKGEYFAQVLVIEKPKIEFNAMDPEEWDLYSQEQSRGEGGFGSSDKNG